MRAREGDAGRLLVHAQLLVVESGACHWVGLPPKSTVVAAATARCVLHPALHPPLHLRETIDALRAQKSYETASCRLLSHSFFERLTRPVAFVLLF